MNLHRNAALSLKGWRELCRGVVEGERTLSEAAEAAEVSFRCARPWVVRYRAEGEAGLLERSSAPRSIPHRTSGHRVQAIAALRRLRFTGPEIAECRQMALSTVSGILTRIGMASSGGSVSSRRSATSASVLESSSISTSSSLAGSSVVPGTASPAGIATQPP